MGVGVPTLPSLRDQHDRSRCSITLHRHSTITRPPLQVPPSPAHTNVSSPPTHPPLPGNHHYTITAPSLHHHRNIRGSLPTITAPTLHHHRTITVPSPHHHCGKQSGNAELFYPEPSLYHHCTIPAPGAASLAVPNPAA